MSKDGILKVVGISQINWWEISPTARMIGLVRAFIIEVVEVVSHPKIGVLSYFFPTMNT